MTDSTRSSIAIVAVVLGCLGQPGSALAQSIDACMSARILDALQICKSIIDGGGRNADVYWKLSSALYQNGQPSQADQTLSVALQLHPRNEKLLALKEIISSDSSEQALIAESTQLNQSSLDKGALKIQCLTKSGEVGISACRRRLELTNDDDQRMRTRLAELESKKRDAIIATAPEIPVEIRTPSPELTTQPEPTVIVMPIDSTISESERLAGEARAKAYKTLVTQVQKRLNEFGFNAGIPDGVPGNRTTRALSDFYNAINAPASLSITPLTLEDLNNSQLAARTQPDESVLDSVLASSATANSESVPAESVPAESVPAESVPSESVPAAAASSTLPDDKQSTLAITSTNRDSVSLIELMGQINFLNGQIKRKQEEQSQQLNQMRRAFEH